MYTYIHSKKNLYIGNFDCETRAHEDARAKVEKLLIATKDLAELAASATSLQTLVCVCVCMLCVCV